MSRRSFPILAGCSFVVFLAAGLLWLRTEALGRTDTLYWGGRGVYRCIELSGDDLEYKALYDPGYAAGPLRWHTRRSGWMRPPSPSNPAALPKTSVTWYLPQPRDEYFVNAPTSRSVSVPLGFDYGEYPNWYGPGTRLRAWRLSYFAVMLPAAPLPAWWLGRTWLARRKLRREPGRCRRCGYDLRASSGRCPECGIRIPATAGGATAAS